MRSPILMSDVLANSGTRIAVVSGIQSIVASRDVDNNDRLTIVVPQDRPYVADLQTRQVLRFEQYSPAREWRISRIKDGRGLNVGTVEIEAVSLVFDLSNVIMRKVVTGGRTYFEIGAMRLTTQNYIDTYVIPALIAEGYGWIEAGTVASVVRWDQAFARPTALELLQASLTKTGTGEIELRNDNDDHYEIDIPSARGSAAPTLLVRLTRNVQALVRDRQIMPLRNVMIPFGIIPGGDAESAQLGYASFVVTFVSGTTYTIADPYSEDEAVIAFDDQLNGLYLLKTDGTLVQITDSVAGATQTIMLASATGVASGDNVEIRADSSGTMLTELKNPAAIAAFGRIMGKVEVSDGRGERNHTPNASGQAWGSPSATVTLCTANGGSSGANLSIDGLPVGFEVNAGDILYRADTGQRGLIVGVVQTGGTTDGSGNVALVLDRTPSIVVADNLALALFYDVTMPTGWTRTAELPVFKRDMTLLPGSLVGTVSGAHSASNTLALTGLTAGAHVQHGDTVTVASVNYGITFGGTVDGSGNLTVILSDVITASSGAGATITRHDHGGTEGGGTAMVMSSPRLVSGTMYVQSPAYAVRFSADMPTLWATVRFTAYPGSQWSAGGSELPAPKLELIDTATSTVLASVSDIDRTTPAAKCEQLTLQLQYELTTTRSLALRFTVPRKTGASLVGDEAHTTIALRWVMLHIGMDSEVPLTLSSHANKLWHAANRQLLKTPEEPASYSITLRDLSLMGFDLQAEAIVLGGSVRLMVPAMNIDSELRIVGISEDLLNPMNTELTIARLSPRLTKLLAAARKERQYVVVPNSPTITVDFANETVTVDEEPLTAPTTPTPPVETQGAVRAIVERGTEDTAPTSGAVQLVKFARDGSHVVVG